MHMLGDRTIDFARIDGVSGHFQARHVSVSDEGDTVSDEMSSTQSDVNVQPTSGKQGTECCSRLSTGRSANDP